MEHFLTFLQNHLFLSSTLAVLLGLFFFLESKRQGKKVSPAMVGIMTTRDKAKIIDIRDSKDFKASHIIGSTNIPFSQFADHIEKLRAETVPLIIVCNLGHTAGTAVAQLAMPNVYRLDGGITQWRSHGLPLASTK